MAAGSVFDILDSVPSGPTPPATTTFVHAGASLKCSFGMAPSSLVVSRTLMVDNAPMANIMDFAPITNIPPFGMCQSMANPQVSAATAANLGVLTPMPCVPVITAPWAPPKADLLIQNQPALLNNCKLMCAYGGTIEIVS